jgi:hypothetical protein
MKLTRRRNKGRGGKGDGDDGYTTLPGIGDMTHQQVSTCLHIIGSLIPFVLKGSVRSITDFDEIKEVDGGTACAASTTIIKASNRLDAILDDDSRWEVKKVLENQESIEQAVKDQATVMRTQAEHIARPSTKLQPAVGFSPEQRQWVAVYESPDPNLIPIHGVGSTPEEALLAFDQNFTSVVQALAVQAQEPKKPEEPPKTRKVTRKRKPKDTPNE